jgi:hypothetical protein
MEGHGEAEGELVTASVALRQQQGGAGGEWDA